MQWCRWRTIRAPPGARMASSRTRCRPTGTAKTTVASAPADPTVSRNGCKLDAEVSAGDLGPGGRIGSNYLYSERTNLYLNYALENERTDNGLRARRGNLVSGVKTRFSDSTSVYVEERYQDTDSLHRPDARNGPEPGGE